MSAHRPRRRFGQHFLTNTRILSRIVDALEVARGDQVLEIGPGEGTLTGELVAREARVTAIEIDRDLVPLVRERFADVRVVEGDALELDWHQLMGGGGFLLTGNIPYNITSPLLDKALTPPRPLRIVFLVQREVADRITARPGSEEYGSLSVGVQAVARAERVLTVPAGAFHPPPKVDSAVVRIIPLEAPLVLDAEVAAFRRFVTACFGARRKQLARGIRQLSEWSADRVATLLAGLELDPKARPEVLAPQEFVALFRHLIDGGWAPR